MLPPPHPLRTLATAAIACLSLAASAALSPADWELPAEHLRDNGLRGDVVLNGWWELHAPSPEVPEATPVAPEPARVPDVPNPRVRQAHRLERAFTLPDDWADRRLVLEIGSLSGGGTVSLNGVELLTLPDVRFQPRFNEIDIPASALRPGAQRLVVTSGFIGDDVWLHSFPRTDAAVIDTYIHTSFRRMAVDLLLEGRAAPGASLRARVAIRETPDATQPVLAFTSAPFTADARGAWKHVATSPWENPKLWSPDTPELYHYTVELLDASDRVIDAVLPRRFGFREVWLEPKRFVMNGVPLHFNGDTWSRSMNTNLQQREQALATMRIFHAAGLRGVARLSSDTAFTAADEVGVLIAQASVGGLDIPVSVVASLSRDEAGDAGGDADFTGGDEAQYHASRERLARTIRRWREHPAVLTWSIRSPWSRVTLDPTRVGSSENPWDFWPGNNNPENNRLRYMVASRTADYVASLDPFRPVSAQNQPDVQVEFATRYLCDNLDLQEREMFYERWLASDSTKVLMPSEFGAPFAGHQFLRKRDHQMPQGPRYPAIHLENAARLFGDEVYSQEPYDRFSRWHNFVDSGHKLSPVYQRLTAENVLHIWRSWRTAGVNALAHWVLREGFGAATDGRGTTERLDIPAEVDPRRPGRAIAATTPPTDSSFPFPGLDRALAGGEAYLRAVAPLHAYLGGSATHGVNNKNHLFLPGDRIEKRVVILNDHFRAIPLTGQWELLAADNNPVLSGPLAAHIAAGARDLDSLPLAFDAPAVTTRTDYTLRVSLTSDDGRDLTDTFALTVFPRDRAPLADLGARVWFVTPSGDDQPDALLAATGLPALPLVLGGPAPQPADLVLVLRGALHPDAAGADILKAHDIDALVARGLRLLVLEQAAPDVLGLRTESVRPRRTFIAADGHPALAGLRPSDFTYWTGASDLEVDTPTTNTPELKRFPTRLWHVSNENSVATRTLYRPHTGANRALLVSGFDLQETPLLETARGLGRIVFCQLDVSNRYGQDPVATRVVDNLLRYLATAPPPDPARSILTPLAADDPGVEVRDHVYLAAKPAGESGWGVTQAELFFREAIYTRNEITRTRPDGRLPVLAGTAEHRPEVVRRDPATGLHATTLDLALFETGWARRKAAFVHGALIINQGGSLDEGPALRHHGDGAALYPHRFLEGFIDPYTAACW